MRNLYLTLISCFVFAFATSGQGSVRKLFGTTSQGGAHLDGTLYSINTDGTGFTKIHDFDSINGKHPHGILVQLPNGRLAGVTAHGGSFGKGVLYTINTDGSDYTVIKNFPNAWPSMGLLLASDGMLYGATASTQTHGGVVFRISPLGTGYTELAAFDPLPFDLHDLVSPLIELPDGRLVGTSFYGNGGGGFAYQLAKDGTGFSTLYNFTFEQGEGPRSVMLASNDRLYFTTSSGGDTSTFPGGYGSIISMNTDGSDVQEVFSWTNAPGGLGKYPHTPLTEGPDGKLYGTTIWNGESTESGLIFNINKDGSGYTVIHLAELTTGVEPTVGVTFSPDGRLYAGFMVGGTFSRGTIIAMNLDGGSPEVVKHFDEESGMIPGIGLLLVGEVKAPVINPPCCWITGIVTKPGDINLVRGMAKLYFAEGGLAQKSDVQNGQFEMDSVPKGQYILQIIPLGADDNDVFPTYYRSTHFHDEADVITVEGSVTLTMQMLRKDNGSNSQQGQGIISGRVIVGSGNGGRLITGRTMVGVGAPNIPVYLLDPIVNTIQKHAVTDQDGNFEIIGVASGQYRLALDMVGASMESTSAAFDFDEATSQLEVTATISGTDIITIDLSIDLVTHAEAKASPTVSVFPNPVDGPLTIMNGGEPSSWKMMALDGREITNLRTETAGDRSVVDVTSLPGGLYILVIRSKSGTSLVKFMKR